MAHITLDHTEAILVPASNAKVHKGLNKTCAKQAEHKRGGCLQLRNGSA